MNAVSIIILVLVAAAFVVAVYLAFFKRGRSGGSCCSDCASKGICQHRNNSLTDCSDHNS